MFNERKFFLHHILTFPRTVSIFTWNSIKLLRVKSMLVLSANKTGIAFWFMTAGKSFMYKTSSAGASTAPCGTASLIIAQFEAAVL